MGLDRGAMVTLLGEWVCVCECVCGMYARVCVCVCACVRVCVRMCVSVRLRSGLNGLAVQVTRGDSHSLLPDGDG